MPDEPWKGRSPAGPLWVPGTDETTADGQGYAVLWARSNFTFLTGASHPEELVETAAIFGLSAIAITDRESLAGVVRGFSTRRAIERRLAHDLRPEETPDAVGTNAQPVRSLPKLLVGSELSLLHGSPHTPGSATAGPRVVALARDLNGYGNLSQLLTRGRLRRPKGECELYLDDLLELAGGLELILIPPDVRDLHRLARETTARTRTSPVDPLRTAGLAPLNAASIASFRDAIDAAFAPPRTAADDDTRRPGLSVGLLRRLDAPSDRAATQALAADATALGVPSVALNGVEMHIPDRKPLHDVLACIREGTTLDQAGLNLLSNAEHYLRSPARMHALFADLPDALAMTNTIAARCTFTLDELQFIYPDEDTPPGETPIACLTRLAHEGAANRYPHGVPLKVTKLLKHELAIIHRLDYASYFLTIVDIVWFAKAQNILCQGRGSAANSAVCFCLGVTEVDPSLDDDQGAQLLFERFISEERAEPPDIDVDFEHERREEVLQYVYQKYGRDHAGMVCEVIRYRGRSARREVAKALGLSLDQADRAAKLASRFLGGSSGGSPGSMGASDEEVRDAGLDPEDRRVQMTLALARELAHFPRHLSIHVGGFVISKTPLYRLVPIENAAMADRTVIQWDKDDAEALGLMKVDCLGLGMLTAIRKSFDMIAGQRASGYATANGYARLSLAAIPPADEPTYEMIRRADTIGVFQIESRAQIAMTKRMQPRTFYDLVIQIAIVRPGPIQGGMVHPYMRRRAGDEKVEYPVPQLEPALRRTLGIPLFQEQCMQLAIAAAGFTPGEADGLRRAMAAWQRTGTMGAMRDRLINGMLANGIAGEYAERIYKQISGFGEYGFPESHSASFAVLAYVSCWLKAHHRAAFLASIMNSQPMGFYSNSTLIRDAQAEGVTVLPIDVTVSQWDCTLEPDPNADAPGRAPPPPTSRTAPSPPLPSPRDLGVRSDTHAPLPSNPSLASLVGAERHGAGVAMVVAQTLTQPPPSAATGASPHAAVRHPDDYRQAAGEGEAQSDRPRPALRLGLRLIRGLSKDDAERILAARRACPFHSVEDLARRALLDKREMRRLADAGAFRTLVDERRAAIWDATWDQKAGRIHEPLFEMLDDVPATPPHPTGRQKGPRTDADAVTHPGLGAGASPDRDPDAAARKRAARPRLRVYSDRELVSADYVHTGHSLHKHPMELVRHLPALADCLPCAVCDDLPHSRRVRVAGLVQTRQRPGTAKGVVFLTLEDEHGACNAVCWPGIANRYRKEVFAGRFLAITGEIQREGDLVHLITEHIDVLDALFAQIPTRSRDFH